MACKLSVRSAASPARATEIGRFWSFLGPGASFAKYWFSAHAPFPTITVFSSRCLPCEIIRFLPISRLLQIACGAALGRFYCWKQLYVREPDAPLRMPLKRGADEAATAGQRQGEHRDESGESCDRGV